MSSSFRLHPDPPPPRRADDRPFRDRHRVLSGLIHAIGGSVLIVCLLAGLAVGWFACVAPWLRGAP